MMTFMKPYFPPQPEESLVSWCSRFGRFQCGLSIQDFLKRVGISQQDLIMGKRPVIEKLAGISGVPIGDLMAISYEILSDQMFRYRNETFHRKFLSRKRDKFCPACILSDIENGHELGIWRMNWMFSPVRTCSIHGLPLCRRRHCEGGYLDCLQFEVDPKELGDLLRVSKPRQRSGLQAYVETRLANGKGTPWLDTQSIDHASRATEMLGACVAFGAYFSPKKLTDDDWDNAGRIGFEFTSKGEEGICEALELIRGKPQRNPAQSGPQGTFGKLYQWLQFKKNVKPVGPIRDVLREHILNTHFVQPGSVLFGETVDRTRRHTVASLSSKYGVHAKTVSHALWKAGLMTSEEAREGRKTVLAEPAEYFIGKLVRAIPVAKIPQYIGCTRSQAGLLLEAGILRPIVSDDENSSGRHKGVDAEDLDRLIDSLRQNGRPVEAAETGMADIGTAANALGVPSMKIVSLVLERQLKRIDLLPAHLKFRSVLVCKEEVVFKLGARSGKAGMSVSAAARELGVPLETVHFLLRSHDGEENPVLNACGQVRHMGVMRDLVDRDSLDDFKSNYRKLSQIEGFWVREPDRLRSRLVARGVRPVWDPAVAGVEFYRVSDI